VGTTHGVAACHLIPFGHLVLYDPAEVRKGVMEIAYLALYGLCPSDLSGLGIGVVADKVGIEQAVYQLRLALAEGLFQKLLHLSLVLFGHVLIPPSEVGSLADASNPRPYQPLGKASMTTR
jgi:hypothetical protein